MQFFALHKLCSARHLSPLQHQYTTTFSEVTSLSQSKPDIVLHPVE